MHTPTQTFQQQGFVHLNSVLEPNIAEVMKNYVTLRASNGLMVQDEQCPISMATYGDPLFDTMMATLCDGFSKVAGEPLLPTYTYHRIYRRGEILKVHRDRPSCEISATCMVAIAPESVPSALYANMSEPQHATDGQAITMQPGDAVLYRGCDLYHWRNPMEPEWQIQCFFHYVRANGPHAEWAFDKRPRLGIPK